jgi:hypothetical protein
MHVTEIEAECPEPFFCSSIKQWRKLAISKKMKVVWIYKVLQGKRKDYVFRIYR